jgi:hypothetical protein
VAVLATQSEQVQMQAVALVALVVSVARLQQLAVVVLWSLP